MLVRCHRCNKVFQKNPCKVRKAKHVFCSPECHYQWRRDTPPPSRKELVDTFFSHVVQSDEESCWLWAGPTISGGYGWVSFRKGRGGETAHRFSYEIHKGPIQQGLVVRHTCDRPWCVNPNHLLTGTQQDNMADMKRRGRSRRDPTTHKMTKLTPDDVRSIRSLIQQGDSQGSIAKRFNVSRSTIADIAQRRTWSYVSLDTDSTDTASDDSPFEGLIEGRI